MDFITNLPEVNGNNAIVTFVDTFTKQANFIPCNIKISAQQLAKVYIKEICRSHGLSRIIICDREPNGLFQISFSAFSDMPLPLTRFSNSEATRPFSDIEDYKGVFFRYKDY